MKNSEPDGTPIDITIEARGCESGGYHVEIHPGQKGAELTNVEVACGFLSLIKTQATARGITLKDIIDYCLPLVESLEPPKPEVIA